MSAIRRQRGVVRGSITRLRSRLSELKGKTDELDMPSHARRMAQRLETLDSEFKNHHYAIIESLEREEDLAREQNVLDEHDEEKAQLSVSIEMLIASCPPTPSSNPSGRRLIARKLAHLKKKLDSAATAIGAESVDVCLLQQYEVNLAENWEIFIIKYWPLIWMTKMS